MELTTMGEALEQLAREGYQVDDGSGLMDPLAYRDEAEALLPGHADMLVRLKLDGPRGSILGGPGVPLIAEKVA